MKIRNNLSKFKHSNRFSNLKSFKTLKSIRPFRRPSQRIIEGSFKVTPNKYSVPLNIQVPEYFYHPTGEPITSVDKQIKQGKEALIHDKQTIQEMRRIGRIAGQVLKYAGSLVKVGITTQQIDEKVFEYIVDHCKCFPSPLRYMGFPKSICTSVNNVIARFISVFSPLIQLLRWNS